MAHLREYVDVVAAQPEADVVVHYDATYKLTKLGYSIITIGYSDFSGQWHTLALGLTSQKKAADVEWFFNSLAELFDEELNFEFKPTKVMGDGDDAQYNGVMQALGPDTLYLMCWFHVCQNVRSYVTCHMVIIIPTNLLD